MNGFLVLKGKDVEVAGAPEIISVLPFGHVVSQKGEFDVDHESLDAIKAQIAKHGVDLVIDYEHQTLGGGRAPAAGWVKELLLKGSGIAARVEWTPRAAQYLKDKEYRYLSPVVTVRKSDNKVMGLHSLALTNTPAIEGMTAIVNSQNFKGGQNNMELMEQIIKLLGLEQGATAEEVLQALRSCIDESRALKDSAGTDGSGEDIVANKAVCELLGLKAGAATEDVTAQIMALKSGNIGGVNVLDELRALKRQAAERDADDAVEIALKSGKISPAQREWAYEYALTSPKGFAAFAEKAPQVIPLGEIDLGDVKALKADRPDAATLLACKQLGVTEDDLKKFARR